MTGRTLTRRAFIIAAVLGVAGLAIRRGRRPADEAAFVRKILSLRAPYARLDPRQRDLFVADYLRHEGGRVRATIELLRLPSLYGRPEFDGLITSAANRTHVIALERRVVTVLLLSCRYFDTQKGERGATLSYRGWPSACANPFARRRTASA